MSQQGAVKIPKNATRILYVKGLPHKIGNDDLYDIFSKHGSIRQIRVGVSAKTRGTGYVVYDDIVDAKEALDNLNGFNVAGRYLALSYFDPIKQAERLDKKMMDEEIRLIREKSGFV